MIVCLCGCGELSHALGEGICECGCPAFRPYQPYTPEMERNDRQHDGVAESHIALHSLTPDLQVHENEGAMWILFPDEEALDPDSDEPATLDDLLLPGGEEKP